jgi:protein SCO1
MRWRAWFIAGVAAAGALVLGGCGRPREEGSSSSTGAGAGAVAPAAEVRVAPAVGVRVPDEELVDQDGAPVRLRELLADKVVAVNFVFTTCTTICSPMTAIFAKLQGELGGAMERRVRLVTISLDPAVDTPERLKRYSDRFDRRNGWTFLTGAPERVGRVLDALGGRSPAKESHAPLTLIGSAGEGRWTRVDGIAPARRLADEIEAFSQPTGTMRSGVAP